MTGVGEDPFICICADGFGGDTCNLTETGRVEKAGSARDDMCGKRLKRFYPFYFLQDRAVLTPVGTTAPARSSLRPDEGMFSMNTSASASPGSKERTARLVSCSCLSFARYVRSALQLQSWFLLSFKIIEGLLFNYLVLAWDLFFFFLGRH